MAAHQHAPFLERRASAHAGEGGLVAASRPFFFALTRELDIIRVILRSSYTKHRISEPKGHRNGFKSPLHDAYTACIKPLRV